MAVANMTALWSRIRRFYEANGTRNRYSILKISMFTNVKAPKQKMPCLKGKAAEVRSLGPALLDACQFLMDAGDPLHAQVMAGLQMSIKMETILDEHAGEWKLPGRAADDYLEACYNYLAFFTSLANTYQKAPYKFKLFNVTIKAHYLLHSAMMARFLNPRLTWCYSAEDYMHCCKILGQSCVKGTVAWSVSSKMAEKWLIGYGTRLSKPKL